MRPHIAGRGETSATLRNAWRYMAEMLVCAVLCIVLSLLSKRFLPSVPGGAARAAVALLPMPAIALMAVATLRSLRRLDEYQRRRTIAAWAIAGGATAIMTFGYGLLEAAGWPHLNSMLAWPVMGLAWAGCLLVDGLRNKP